MRKLKNIIPLGMAVMLAAASPVQAMAETLQDYDEETQARLQDNVLEYDELPDLVAVYNLTVRNGQQNIDDNMFVYQDAENDFKRQASDMRDKAKDAKSEGNMLEYQAYMVNAITFSKTAESYGKAITNMQEVKSTRSIRQLKYTLTSAAQSLMSAYEELNAQRELASKGKELAQAAYQSAQTQAGLGMATEADLLSAQKNLNSASNALVTVEASFTKVKQNLCLMTGWDFNANPDIRSIPEPDTSVIDGIDLEADKARAIGNNFTLISERSGGRDDENWKRSNRTRSISEAEQNLSIEIEQLYLAMVQKRTEKQAADAGYASAVTAKNAADKKYQMGMLSRIGYLEAEKDFLEKKANKISADMAFLLSVEAYDWGIEGLTSDAE